MRIAAARAVGGLGGAAATPEILARLAELLRDQDSDVRWTATRALAGLGVAAATPEILARLAELLRDQDSDVRWAAVNAVGGLGGAAAITEILTRLADLPHAAPEGLRFGSPTLASLARRLGLRFVRHRDKIIPCRLADLACGREYQEACP
jgi:HEAT repeat protein